MSTADAIATGGGGKVADDQTIVEAYSVEEKKTKRANGAAVEAQLLVSGAESTGIVR